MLRWLDSLSDVKGWQHLGDVGSTHLHCGPARPHLWIGGYMESDASGVVHSVNQQRVHHLSAHKGEHRHISDRAHGRMRLLLGTGTKHDAVVRNIVMVCMCSNTIQDVVCIPTRRRRCPSPRRPPPTPRPQSPSGRWCGFGGGYQRPTRPVRERGYEVDWDGL